MVELTLVWNHVINVNGHSANISHSPQQLRLLIGVLSLIQICWLIFKQWRDGKNSSYDESQTGREKGNTAPEAPDTPNAGLGVIPSFPACADVADAACDGRDSNINTIAKRGIVIRYTIAYLPWLSQFEFWKTGYRHWPLQSVVGDEGYSYRDSHLADV